MYVLKIQDIVFARSTNKQMLERLKAQFRLDNALSIYCYIVERETNTNTKG